MSGKPKLGPCSVCEEEKRISFHKKEGSTRITSSKWYRETVRCNACRTEVHAVAPGNAVKLWNANSNGFQG